MSIEQDTGPQGNPGDLGEGAKMFAGLSQNPEITRAQVEAKAQVPLREAAENQADTWKSDREMILKESIPKAVEAGEVAAEQYDRQTASAAKVAEEARRRLGGFIESGSPADSLTTLPDGTQGLVLRGITFDEGDWITEQVAQQFAKQLGAEEARAEAVVTPFEPSIEFQNAYQNRNPGDYAVMETPIAGGAIHETVMRDGQTSEPKVIQIAFRPDSPPAPEAN